MSKLHHLLRTALICVPTLLLTAGSANAAAPATPCRTQWVEAFKGPVGNIEGNAYNLFLWLAIPLAVVAIIAAVFLYFSRHRSTAVTFLLVIFAALIALWIVPGLVDSLKPGC